MKPQYFKFPPSCTRSTRKLIIHIYKKANIAFHMSSGNYNHVIDAEFENLLLDMKANKNF